MKGILLFIVVCIFTSCVHQHDTDIETLISQTVKKDIPKSWSYESIAFSISDSAMSKLEDSKQYKELVKDMVQMDSIAIYSDKQKEEIDKLKSEYTPHYIGQRILHAYLCSTDSGDSLFIDTYIVGVDGNITKSNATSVYVSFPDSVRMESTKKQLKQFLDEAVKLTF